jgi:hypothetical protein
MRSTSLKERGTSNSQQKDGTQMEDTMTMTVTDVENSSANLTTEVVTYRTYGAFDANSQATGVKEDGSLGGKPSVQSQSNDGKNWTAAEKRGAVVLNENAYRFYKLQNLEGFETLVPDSEQRLYIVQKGIDAIQTAAANRKQVELQEKNSKDDPDVFAYNNETIDLRDDINTPPQRRNLTDEQKFLKAIGTLEASKALKLLEQFKASLIAQGASLD